MKNTWLYFSPFERALWLTSVLVIILSYALGGEFDALYCTTSLIGVTALIYMAKGNVMGQILSAVFGLLYAYISFEYHYYGEMLTYLGMTVPMSIAAAISWFRHPYEEGKKEVEIAPMTGRKWLVLGVLTVFVTVLGYFVLGYWGTANLWVSTFSVATSFAAVFLTYHRSHWYAVGYALNDVVLMILWILATFEDRAYFTMVLCFTLFLVNDMYAYVNWRRMGKRQGEVKEQ